MLLRQGGGWVKKARATERNDEVAPVHEGRFLQPHVLNKGLPDYPDISSELPQTLAIS